MSNRLHIPFDNTYARDLEGLYAPWEGHTPPNPRLLKLNEQLARELQIDETALRSDAGVAFLSGGLPPTGAAPLAMAYAGHQFGSFSPQLGDGRALLIGELIDRNGARRDIHLKGAGRTPFSRGGDGKAAIGPVLREYLVGEAMNALGIPTTRALAATLTGEEIERDGHKQGAVLARVAASHLRVGTFQYFAARGKTEKVRRLAEYAIARHFPAIVNKSDRYLAFFAQVSEAQAALVARWMLVGFVHGVMNTDNMTISGETIDYGPCAFIDAYDPDAVFSSIDRFGRYAYGKQPTIAQWNLARFAETLIDVVDPSDSENAVRRLTDILNAYPTLYQKEWMKGVRAKLGLIRENAGDSALAADLFEAMRGQNVDFTKFFRTLSSSVRGDATLVRALFAAPEQAFDAWLARYLRRLDEQPVEKYVIASGMDQANPIYIPRNHKVEEALQAAEAGDMQAFERLLRLLTQPYVARKGAESYEESAPVAFGRYMTFCGT